MGRDHTRAMTTMRTTTGGAVIVTPQLDRESANIVTHVTTKRGGGSFANGLMIVVLFFGYYIG